MNERFHRLLDKVKQMQLLSSAEWKELDAYLDDCTRSSGIDGKALLEQMLKEENRCLGF